MTRKSGHTRIRSIGKRGKATELKADLLEFDFGGGRRLGVYLTEGGDQGLEIVVLGDEPDSTLSVEARSASAILVRLESADSEGVQPVTISAEGLAVGKDPHEPLLNLKIQKAVSGTDRDQAEADLRLRFRGRQVGEAVAHVFVLIGAGDVPAANPAFDVTPAALISDIISERGIAAAGALDQWAS